MITYNTNLKELPKHVKFATYNEDNKDIILENTNSNFNLQRRVIG